MDDTSEKPRAATMTIKLDTACRDRLKTLAVTKRRTPHYLMKEAIERYLKAEEAQQVILKSVDDATTQYETTGLHISLDEATEWAKEIKTNRNAQLPACHP